jgi:protocatechuate 3,4-dioxygenase beta subunit
VVKAGIVILGIGLVVGGAGLLAAAKPDGGEAPAQAAPPKAETGSVHARVVDREGKPVAGVVIKSLGAKVPAPSAVTDPDGRAVFPREAFGEYDGTLVARHGDALGWAAYSADRDRLATDRRPPAGTPDDPLVLTLVPLNRKVTGSVIDTRGRPIAGVRVAVETLGLPGRPSVYVYGSLLEREGWPFGTAVTDEQGRYALTLPEGATAWLRALHPRYIGLGSRTREDSDTVYPVTLEPAGGIAGTVVDAATGAPIAGVKIGAQLLEQRQRLLGSWGDAISGADGRFTIGGLEPGVYNLSLWHVPSRDRATARAVEAVRVRVDEETTADFRVIEGRPLRGVVVDSQTGKPIAGVPVGCYGPAHPRSGAAVESHKTDEQGRFTFHVPPGWQYVYVMEIAAGRSRLGSCTVDVPEAGEVSPVQLVHMSQTPANGPAMIKKEMVREAKAAVAKTEVKAAIPAKVPEANAPAGRTVTGLVRDVEGRPLVGASVYLDFTKLGGAGPQKPLSISATTDRDGLFILRGLPPGDLPILINVPATEPMSSRVIERTIPADKEAVDFEVHETPTPPRNWRAPVADEPVPPGLKSRLTFVDLGPKGNEFLPDGPGGVGNDLARLPAGVHQLGGAFFHVGVKLVHLTGKQAPGLPAAVAGIAAGARADRVHFLHAVQQSERDGTEVGAYVVRYADGTSERVPVVYGRDLLNWWRFPGEPNTPPTGARIAWEGTNDTTDMNEGITLRLFARTWVNPYPEKAIATIDATSNTTVADPFLVAVTLERDAPAPAK